MERESFVYCLYGCLSERRVSQRRRESVGRGKERERERERERESERELEGCIQAKLEGEGGREEKESCLPCSCFLYLALEGRELQGRERKA